MKTIKILAVLITFFFSINLTAQCSKTGKKYDSIKSVEYRVFKAKIVNGKMTKGESTYFFDGYPVQYPTAKQKYNNKGFLIGNIWSYQQDHIYYNIKNQKEKQVLYLNNNKDSITIDYIYDKHGNIQKKTMSSSAPELDYRLGGNYYSYKSIVNEYFKNYYISEQDYLNKNDYDKVKLEVNYIYRLYNQQNYLLAEKQIFTNKNNPYSNKLDTTILSRNYEYTKNNCIKKLIEIRDYKTGSKLAKGYSVKKTELHEYSNDGMQHIITFLNNKDRVERTKIYTFNSRAVLINYVDKWGKKTEERTYNNNGEIKNYIITSRKVKQKKYKFVYEYNSRGDWIKCIHFDLKNKPKYIVERLLEYY